MAIVIILIYSGSTGIKKIITPTLRASTLDVWRLKWIPAL